MNGDPGVCPIDGAAVHLPGDAAVVALQFAVWANRHNNNPIAPPRVVGPPCRPGSTPLPREIIEDCCRHPPGTVLSRKPPTTRAEAEGSDAGASSSRGGSFAVAPEDNGLPGGQYALPVRRGEAEGRAGSLSTIRGEGGIDKAGK